MTVAVLPPRDCLIKDYGFTKQHLISPPTKDSRNSSPNFNNHRANRVQQQPHRTKRSPPRSHKNNQPPSRAAAATNLRSPAKNNLVMEEVKLLKRGEKFSFTAAKPVPSEPEKKKVSSASAVKKRTDMDLGSTERLGPEPESVPAQIRLADSKNRAAPNFYAGSAFITSPPPSSLPLPAFFTKKSVSAVKNDDATDDDATANLMRLLKLDMKQNETLGSCRVV